MKKEQIVPGVDLQRIRIVANLTHKELVAKLGDGGCKAGNVTIYETENRYVGLTLLKQWALACDYQFRIVFDPHPAVPPRPAPSQFPIGWFTRRVFAKQHTVKHHYDLSTGRSLCGEVSS